MAELRVPETADEVWTVLVEECGADPDGLAVFSALWPCSEYRFGGDLGFGGKVRWHQRSAGVPPHAYIDGWASVDCYPEDRTDDRVEACVRANSRFQRLIGGKEGGSDG